MLIRSNIGLVVRRLRRLEEEIPKALREAVSPTYWKPRFEIAAKKAIQAQWASEPDLARRELYERLTPKVVETLVGRLVEGGAEFLLFAPPTASAVMGASQGVLAQAAAFNLGNLTPMGRERKYATSEQEQMVNLERARTIVREWVTYEKRHDSRDTRADGSPLSDEEVAENIMALLGIGGNVVPRSRGAAVQEAADKLHAAIEQWLAGDGTVPVTAVAAEAAGLVQSSPESVPDGRTGSVTGSVTDGHAGAVIGREVVDQWLRAVLLAWKGLLLGGGLRHRVSWELLKAGKKVGQEML